ncbi:16S rRNA (cytosine967-C5)-methyltransferase [Paracoccus saliphilus]|uniref:16S rRNA (Cytosine967-C5)-methyltransferase n=2 Tax=Paracoccus saliphilus TaxID=405559 RepID=A0AA46A5R4_9RHOB|nr:16S rRNA (cytosine967-C5)-methyltransferase [Paracoccus saliphilus]
MDGQTDGAVLERRLVTQNIALWASWDRFAEMTPAARINAAIGLLDEILDGRPAEQVLLRWSRASRYAGSGDRAAVRDLVYEALRRRNSLAALGGRLSGRGLMIGLCREAGQNPDEVFTGATYAPEPLSEEERAAAGGEAEDLPDWLLPLWRHSLGADAAAVARAMGARAPVWLRVNPLRGTVTEAMAMLAEDGVEAEASRDLPSALRVTSGERRVNGNRAYREGLVELQDLSPQLACAALPLREDDRVLDYCAGGGGKALALAGRQSQLRLFAHDAEPARMGDLPARAKRAGTRIEQVSQPKGVFDLVLADVPCSGSGTWRRTPDAKWRLTEAMLERLFETQAEILDEAAGRVAPGGHLAYMTCSLLKPENEAAIDAFLARNAGFTQVSRQRWTPLTASDGFFMALLKHN